MKYSELVRSSKGSEETMRKSIENIDDFLDEMRQTSPKSVRCFMERQYEDMNGKHINETVAKMLVSKMYHTDSNGNTISGEAVTPDEAMSLISDKPTEKQEKCRWDAYVAANAFSHDLGTTSLSKSDIMKAAKAFWFHDDDFNESNKVYWYFKDWIFG